MLFRLSALVLLASALLKPDEGNAAPTPKSPFHTSVAATTMASSELTTNPPRSHLDIIPKHGATQRPAILWSGRTPKDSTDEPTRMNRTVAINKNVDARVLKLKELFEARYPKPSLDKTMQNEFNNFTSANNESSEEAFENAITLEATSTSSSFPENVSSNIINNVTIHEMNQNATDFEVNSDDTEPMYRENFNLMLNTSIPELGQNDTNISDKENEDTVHIGAEYSTDASIRALEKDPELASTTDNWSSTFVLSDEDEKMNDTLFDVVIGDHASSNFTAQSTNNNTSSQFLEVDSEEFFVPADIKERETTTTTSPPEIAATLTPRMATGDEPSTHPVTINEDAADTVFYISNTEVKVREVQPTANTNPELQFFPAAYQEDVIIDVRRKNTTSWDDLPHQYTEDLIVSKQHQHQPQPNKKAPGFVYEDAESIGSLDVEESISYMGESYIEVREFSRNSYATELPITQQSAAAANSNLDYVIIQPLPAMESAERTTTTVEPPPIGVPVIEMLPPSLISQFSGQQVDASQNAASPIADFNARSSLVQNHDQQAGGSEDEASMGGASILEPVRLVVNEKRAPTKRNGGGASAANATAVAAESLNGTAAKVFDANEEPFILGMSEPTALYVFKWVTHITPIVFVGLIAFVARFLWLKRQNAKEAGIQAANQRAFNDELQTQNAFGFRSTSVDDTRRKSNLDPRGDDHQQDDPTNPSSHSPPTPPRPIVGYPLQQLCCQSAAALQQQPRPPSSGSLTTLTMKNNQLIVETEELYDIPRNTRETNIRYSSNERDSVFVVEVSRGADSMGAINEYNDCSLPPVHLGNGLSDPVRDDVSLLPNEEFQVHRAPADTDNEAPTTNGIDNAAVQPLAECSPAVATNLKTGLSQSNLSLASSCNSNRGYSYGPQQHYTIETGGYQSSAPAPAAAAPPSPVVPNDVKADSVEQPLESSKPIIRSAIYKQESIEKTTQILEEAIALNRVETIPESSDVQTELPIGESKSTVEPSVVETTNDTVIHTTTTPAPLAVCFENGLNKSSPIHSVISLDAAPLPDDGPFDSLINLPEPPSLDEIQLLNEITSCEHNNMDSLPPPPLDD